MKLYPLIKQLLLFNTPILESFGKFLDSRIFVHEGLIRSEPIDKVITLLKKIYDLDTKINYDWNPNNPAISIRFKKSKNFDKIEKVFELMNKLGWIGAQIVGDQTYTKTITFNKSELPLIKNNNEVIVVFESKFVENLNYENLSEKLYHISPIERIDKIQKIGLTPRSGDKKLSYSDRIYLLDVNSFNFKNKMSLNFIFSELSKQLFSYEKNKDKLSGDYVVFYIKKEFFKNKGIYHDSSFPGAIWTNFNIPPNDIYIETIIKHDN